MLTLFPALMSWNGLAPFLLRLVLGSVFIYWSVKTFKGSNPDITTTSATKVLALAEIIASVLLIMGLATQGAALFLAIDLIGRLIVKIKNRAFLTGGINYYLVLFAIALSLLFSGAGDFSMDLPL
jgi:uncharacterized membrane protein YphA (DoxX/SURF4 family)